jgi:hypothetical protein
VKTKGFSTSNSRAYDGILAGDLFDPFKCHTAFCCKFGSYGFTNGKEKTGWFRYGGDKPIQDRSPTEH